MSSQEICERPKTFPNYQYETHTLRRSYYESLPDFAVTLSQHSKTVKRVYKSECRIIELENQLRYLIQRDNNLKAELLRILQQAANERKANKKNTWRNIKSLWQKCKSMFHKKIV